MQRDQLLTIVAATAGAAVGLLLTALARRRPTSSAGPFSIHVSDDPLAELIQRYAPSLDEIARETREIYSHT